jgi:hypothetical protein
MESSLSERKKRLDEFDKKLGQDLYKGHSDEDSRSRVALLEGFDKEMSMAEKSFARGNYVDAIEHRETANRLFTSLMESKP